MRSSDAQSLRETIPTAVCEYGVAAFPDKPFILGGFSMPVSGRVFDADNVAYHVDASLDFWLTTGRFAATFERFPNNTCGKCFDWQLGELPDGYDHKYTYSHVSYTLKLTDMRAAVGVSQLHKLPDFIAKRKCNW